MWHFVRLLAIAAVALSATALSASRAAASSFSTSWLQAPVPASADKFGTAVTSLGSRLIVGAPESLRGFPEFGVGPGRVYVMDALGHATLTIDNPTPADGDEFGAAVAVVGGNILVGAPFDDGTATDAGAAYLFDGTTGALLRTFTVAGLGEGSQCGRRVAALAGNALVLCGARYTSGPGFGAYLFDVGSGAILGYFTAPAGVMNLRFGTIANDVILGDNRVVYRIDGSSGATVAAYADPEPLGAGWGGSIAAHGPNVLIGRDFPVSPETAYLFDGATGALLHSFVGPYFGGPYFEAFGAAVASIGDAIVVSTDRSVYRFDATTYERLAVDQPEDHSHAGIVRGDLAAVFGDSYAAHGYDPSHNDGRGALYLIERCGNGIRSTEEQCDDGNAADGDGCSSLCRLELCPPDPFAAGCRDLTPGGASKLRLRSARRGIWGVNADRLAWSWKGAGTTLADFGDPTTTADYQLCVYDNLASPNLRMDATALASTLCGTGSCWLHAGKAGWMYRDDGLAPSGIATIKLKAGLDGRSQIKITGFGGRLGLPVPSAGPGRPLPFVGNIAVLVRNGESGLCWTAGYTEIRNANGKLKTLVRGY